MCIYCNPRRAARPTNAILANAEGTISDRPLHVKSYRCAGAAPEAPDQGVPGGCDGAGPGVLVAGSGCVGVTAGVLVNGGGLYEVVIQIFAPARLQSTCGHLVRLVRRDALRGGDKWSGDNG